MAKSGKDQQYDNDEFTRIFDEYRAKIEEITRKTEQNLEFINDAVDVVDEFDEPDEDDTPSETEPPEPEPTATQVQPEPDAAQAQPDQTAQPVEVIWPSEKESVEIIKQAKRKAQELITQAEASIKKEAKKRTHSQVEKILGKAKKEAEYIITQAREAAEKIRENAVAVSRREVEQLLKEITEKCRHDAMGESSRIINDTQGKADKMMTDIVTSSTEINRLVTEIVNKAKNTIGEFEAKLQEDTDELAKAIAEAQQKLEEAITLEPEPVQEHPDKNGEIHSTPVLQVHLVNENRNGNKGKYSLYSGQIEMRGISSALDYQYVKKLKKYLVNLPSIKYLQESASEKEMSVLFEAEEPLPLLEILRDMPLVDRVVKETDNDLRLVFKEEP